MKVIGLISVKDSKAFDLYKSGVGETIALYGGTVRFRGQKVKDYWNELPCPEFEGFVEIDFPSEVEATRWAKSPQYQALLAVRSQAMRLTLFGVD